MKKSLHSLLIAAVVSVTAVCSYAAEAVSEAVVLKVTGGAQATLPGQAPAPIKVGDKLPQGTIIETPDNSAVDIQVFSGSKTTIQSGSKVDLSKLSLTTEGGQITKQTAELNLSVGTVVSSLDPANRGINDYSIRTPKGVAAARGTVFTVTAAASGQVTTYVARGVVVFVNPVTGQSVTVQSGQVVTVDENGFISAPVAATAEQRRAARAAFRENPGERAIDITITSSSN